MWNNWQKFNGEQTDPDDSTDFLIPQMVSTATTGYLQGSLHDYFGLPTEIPGYTHMSLPHRGYNLIYNEWFRDQNLQDSVTVDLDDGPDLPADYVLLRRGKRHDYFTSCLPWPQKGPSVDLPLGTTAPVVSTGTYVQVEPYPFDSGSAANLRMSTSGAISYSGGPVGAAVELVFSNNSIASSGLEVDLSAATAATITQLRQAFQIQKLYERDARGGTRYVEILKSHFGVTSPDARLQRPEYLGGGSSSVNISPIAQTSSTSAEPTPLGDLAAIGTVAVQGHGFTKSFTEHCLIFGFVSVRADLTYQQGLNRMWSRLTRWDFYWPALAHIG